MFKFVFYLCISALVFCESSGFWFDILNDENYENTLESSNKDSFDELVEWISKCFFGLDSGTERPNSVPSIGNLTTPPPINANLGSKNSSSNQGKISASNVTPDISSVGQTPPAVPQNVSVTSATNKDNNTEKQNTSSFSKNSVENGNNDNEEITTNGENDMRTA